MSAIDTYYKMCWKLLATFIFSNFFMLVDLAHFVIWHIESCVCAIAQCRSTHLVAIGEKSADNPSFKPGNSTDWVCQGRLHIISPMVSKCIAWHRVHLYTLHCSSVLYPGHVLTHSNICFTEDSVMSSSHVSTRSCTELFMYTRRPWRNYCRHQPSRTTCLILVTSGV